MLEYVLMTSSLHILCVMFLNPKQIDKTNKTLLDLRARCVGDGSKLQEVKSNPEIHPVRGQASIVRGKYILGFDRKGRIMSNLIFHQ